MNARSFIDQIESDALAVEDFAEIVVEKKTGRPKQAGADLPDGAFVNELRKKAERSLFVFTKGILEREYLSPKLHREICPWLTKAPPYRKLLLLPRKHAKTSIVSHGLPIHILIQPRENNLYFPNKAGADTRILLAGETEQRASNNLGVIQSAFENKRLLRALWPQVCWDNPRRESKKWNAREMVVPRSIDFPDPSVQAIGVGGAITGARFDVMIKDDLISVEAANSPTVMQTAIEWHIASRALLDSDSSLEWIIGTRWAVNDLYSYIEENDPTVEYRKRSIVENGEPIYPERFSIERTLGKISVLELQKEFGVLFPLLYMNSATDPSLTDFSPEDIRTFAINGNMIEFAEDERDLLLAEAMNRPAERQGDIRGLPITSETHDLIFRRNEFIRARYA